MKVKVARLRDANLANRKVKKITKYRKPLNINIGMIIFGVMFVYIIICIVMYFRSSHLTGYEVKTGSLYENNVYRGIALREEQPYTASTAGYIYYFLTEGTHVGCSNLVYAIDSSGTLAETLNTGITDSSLSDDDLNDLKTDIVSYSKEFTPTSFNNVYDFKQQADNEISSISNGDLLDSLDSIDSAEAGITEYSTDAAGNVVYYTDGFEDVTADQVTEESFDETNYQKTTYSSDSLVGEGDEIYELVTNEDWTVVIEVDPDRAAEMEEDTYVTVKFLKDQFETSAKVTVYGSNEDGTEDFVGLTFNNSMIDYISDRYLDIELVLDEDSGLKIPNSSIVEKNFFLVPEEYIVQGLDGSDGVMRQTYTEDNEQTTEFVETAVYNVDDDGEYYIDEDALSAGDVLCKEDSTDTYTVSEQASLIGVYNINKGYADFRQITVLYQNDEYSIVESDTTYGLSDYDYIALDAATVKDDQLVTE